jgi:hypothetical protein
MGRMDILYVNAGGRCSYRFRGLMLFSHWKLMYSIEVNTVQSLNNSRNCQLHTLQTEFYLFGHTES